MYVNYNKKTPYTREIVLEKLSTDARWVERAITSLFFERQIALEQQTQATIENNERGFQKMDAKFFSFAAGVIKSREKQGIPEGQRANVTLFYKGYGSRHPRRINILQEARKPWGRNKIPRIAKYRKQILDMIEAKARGER